MTAVKIAPAVAQDAVELSTFCAKQFTDAFGSSLKAADLELHIQRAYSIEKLRAEILKPASLFLKATDDVGLAAYAYLLWQDQPTQLEPAYLQDANIAHLERFYVDARCHGNGMAHLLMTECVAFAQQHRASGLWLTVWTQNPRAQRFYQRHAFRDVGESVFVVGTDPQYDRLYYRPVP